MHACTKKICGKGMELGNIDKALAWNQRSNRIVGHFSCRYPIRVTSYNDFCIGVDTLLVTVLYWPWKPVCLLHSPLDQTLAALQVLQQWNNVVWKFRTVTLCEKRYLFVQMGSHWRASLWVYYRGESRCDCYLWGISSLKCFEYHLAIDLASHFLARTEFMSSL